jgi:outer membrane immunogenic protein
MAAIRFLSLFIVSPHTILAKSLKIMRDDDMKLKLLLAATAAFAAVPAQAQDDVPADFTGPRIEAHVGFARVGIENRDIREFAGRGDFGPAEQDTGALGGGELGFDFQAGPLVVGLYVGADISEGEERFETDFVHLRADRNYYAGARAGFVLSPGVMVYGKGGLSRGNLDVEFLANAPAAIQAAFDDDVEERDGIHFGGGAEFAMGRIFYGRLDFMHTRYDRVNLGNLGRTGPVTNPSYEQRFTRNQITAGVGLRF